MYLRNANPVLFLATELGFHLYISGKLQINQVNTNQIIHSFSDYLCFEDYLIIIVTIID